MNDRTMKNKVMAGVLAATKGNNPRSLTKRHQKQFVLVRVISWIGVTVKPLLKKQELPDLCHPI